MKILLTGADGFIGKNMRVALGERQDADVLAVTRATTLEKLDAALSEADVIVHLAGVNRPEDPSEFHRDNAGFTERLCSGLTRLGRPVPILFTSSSQADRDNPYGKSKLAAEEHLFAYGRAVGAPVRAYRLPGVFGKWCRPNYNSVVATFCHNVLHDLPLTINDPASPLRLVYIDEVVGEFIRAIYEPFSGVGFGEVAPVYETTVGQLARELTSFRDVRNTLVTERVGTGLTRALYATFMSHVDPAQFSYPIPKHGDARGVFVEMLKTRDSGQFSFFTAHPGITRGGHYHHSKTEKFLVMKGKARFKFRHVVTNQTYEVLTSGDEPTIVETIPGWAHDITNIGEDEMFVMLWANEIFDRDRPDTIAQKV